MYKTLLRAKARQIIIDEIHLLSGTGRAAIDYPIYPQRM